MSRRPFVPREKHEQKAGVDLLRWLRVPRVLVLGTTRRRGDYQGTMQTPGVPDVIALLPQGVLFWEVKSRAGRPRPEQAEIGAILRQYEAAGRPIWYCLGPYDALRAKLVEIGLLRPEDVPHYALPASAVSMAVADRFGAGRARPASSAPSPRPRRVRAARAKTETE